MATLGDPSPHILQTSYPPRQCPCSDPTSRPPAASFARSSPQEVESIYSSVIDNFNKIQTQDFQPEALYTTDENVFVDAPAGSGKTICAEFALLRLWSKRDAPRAVCIEPFQDMVDQRVAEWQAKFRSLQNGKEIVSLTGETAADLRLLEKGDVIVCTPTQWDVLSRRWKQRKNIQNIGLLIADVQGRWIAFFYPITGKWLPINLEYS